MSHLVFSGWEQAQSLSILIKNPNDDKLWRAYDSDGHQIGHTNSPLCHYVVIEDCEIGELKFDERYNSNNLMCRVVHEEVFRFPRQTQPTQPVARTENSSSFSLCLKIALKAAAHISLAVLYYVETAHQAADELGPGFLDIHPKLNLERVTRATLTEAKPALARTPRDHPTITRRSAIATRAR